MSHCRPCTILAWLGQQPKPVTAEQLGDHWGVSTRTARRWLRNWEKAGVVMIAQHGKTLQWRAKPVRLRSWRPPVVV